MTRRLLATALTLALTLAPLAGAGAVQSIEADDGAEPVGPVEPPRGLAPCPQTTQEKLAFEDPACLEAGTDARGYPVHTVCLYDTWFPLWTGGELVCATTEHWAYLPAPGMCVDVLDFHEPTACANGNHCVLTVAGIRVLCEA